MAPFHTGRGARLALALAVIAMLIAPSLAAAARSDVYVFHIVQWGENLTRIAARYGVSVPSIVQANHLLYPDWVLVGQQLVIPVPLSPYARTPVPTATVADTPAPTDTPVPTSAVADTPAPTSTSVAAESPTPAESPTATVAPETATPGATAPAEPTPVPADTIHVVQAGETLYRIAARYGTTVSAISALNHLANPNLIYVGQKLRVSGEPTAPPAPTAIVPGASDLSGRWIEVDLSDQALMCWEGATLARYAIVSTGLPGTPTLTGRFAIQTKYLATPMSGPGYYLPNVPHTMYYDRGYAIHGAYWHNNFGQPMSHGCINLSLTDAAWVYAFASVGTPVVIHW